jgi:2-polyprenyl-6-methoxyphenol hydroxylase-like FAD-dependent oxidoreductase
LSKINSQSIYTNKKAIDVIQKENSVEIKFQDGTRHETEFLIAADGIHSAIRKKLVPKSEPRYSGYTCWRAVIDNTKLNLMDSSETWSTKGRFGIVPLANNKIYWFACVNANQNNTSFKEYKVKDIHKQFKNFHEPIPALLRETKDVHLLWNDIIDLKPIDKYVYNNIVLIGDAVHATTPNLGQGACQAIEDAVVIAKEVQENINIKEAFINFEKRRIKRTHYITNTSWTIGKIAQTENKLLAGLRNFIFRLMPPSVNERQLKKLYDVDF